MGTKSQVYPNAWIVGLETEHGTNWNCVDNSAKIASIGTDSLVIYCHSVSIKGPNFKLKCASENSSDIGEC